MSYLNESSANFYEENEFNRSNKFNRSSSINEKPSASSNVGEKMEIEEDFTITLYSKRWLILFIFALISLLSFFNLTQYGDLHEFLIKFYDESLPPSPSRQYDASNWLSILHMITNLVFIIPAIVLLECRGIKWSCITGITLTSIGLCIKCSSLNPDLFSILIIGQVICGVGQAFVQSSFVKLAALWFSKTEQTIAVSVSFYL
jgi:hypothetical protein